MLAVSHLHTVHGNFSPIEIIRNGAPSLLCPYVFQFDPSSHEWLNVATGEYSVCVKAPGFCIAAGLLIYLCSYCIPTNPGPSEPNTSKYYCSRDTGNSLFFFLSFWITALWPLYSVGFKKVLQLNIWCILLAQTYIFTLCHHFKTKRSS